MNYTEKRLEKHTKEVIIEQIDICLSGQDPRYQLGRYVEKLREEIIHQALAEDRARVVEVFAEYIYNQMLYNEVGTKPSWAIRGNSMKQEEARVLAINLLLP